jgi:hypothetical protein
MEIERAVAEPVQDVAGHDHRRHERDQPGARQQVAVEPGEIGERLGRPDLKMRIVPEQRERQRASLGLPRQ